MLPDLCRDSWRITALLPALPVLLFLEQTPLFSSTNLRAGRHNRRSDSSNSSALFQLTHARWSIRCPERTALTLLPSMHNACWKSGGSISAVHSFLCRLYCAISTAAVTLQTGFSCFAPRKLQDVLVGHRGEGCMLAAQSVHRGWRWFQALLPVSTKASKRLKGIKPRGFFTAQITVAKFGSNFSRAHIPLLAAPCISTGARVAL